MLEVPVSVSVVPGHEGHSLSVHRHVAADECPCAGFRYCDLLPADIADIGLPFLYYGKTPSSCLVECYSYGACPVERSLLLWGLPRGALLLRGKYERALPQPVDVAVLDSDQLAELSEIGVASHLWYSVGRPEVERGHMHSQPFLDPIEMDPFDVVRDRVRMRHFLADGDLDNLVCAVRVIDKLDHRNMFLFPFLSFCLN